jgi:hypothetical protein
VDKPSPYLGAMRWEALFRDLEAQAVGREGEQWRAEVAERTRGERAEVTFAARIAAARTMQVALTLRDGARVGGVVTDSGQDWVLLDDAGRQRVVALAAVAAATGLPARADALTRLEQRLSLARTLRALSRDRVRVRVRAGVEVVGLIAAVGADHIDVVTEGAASTITVPIAAIGEVSSL